MSTPAATLETARTGANEEAALEGPDAATGQLFKVPRVAVTVDETDPTILKLAFSGNIEIDRGTASDVELYNRLAAGKTAALVVEAHIGGAKTTHRRDSDGNVDAVVQTKSLIIHSIDLSDKT